MLWKCRKMKALAVGRLAPSYVLQDGVCRAADAAAASFPSRRQKSPRSITMRIVSLAHAGDGNIHPILLFDPADRDLAARVEAASHAVLECIACGAASRPNMASASKSSRKPNYSWPRRPAGDAPRSPGIRSRRTVESRQEAAADTGGRRRSCMISRASADLPLPHYTNFHPRCRVRARD